MTFCTECGKVKKGLKMTPDEVRSNKYIKWSKKTIESSDVNTTISESELDLSSFKTINVKQLFGESEYWNQGFRQNTPMVFIMVVGSKKYLINTEGYNYPRYATRIK